MKYCTTCYASGRIVIGRVVLSRTAQGIPVVRHVTKCCEACKGVGFVKREKLKD